MRVSTTIVVTAMVLSVLAVFDVMTTVEAWLGVCMVSLFAIEAMVEDVYEEIQND